MSFRNYKTPEDVVTQMSKRSWFRTAFDSQDDKRSQTLLKSAR